MPIPTQLLKSIANTSTSTVMTTTVCSKKSDAKIEITITATNLIRINYPLSSFNYHLSGANLASFNKIHCTVFEQQLFKLHFLKSCCSETMWWILLKFAMFVPERR